MFKKILLISFFCFSYNLSAEKKSQSPTFKQTLYNCKMSLHKHQRKLSRNVTNFFDNICSENPFGDRKNNITYAIIIPGGVLALHSAFKSLRSASCLGLGLGIIAYSSELAGFLNEKYDFYNRQSANKNNNNELNNESDDENETE
jgi:hypothetical protein